MSFLRGLGHGALSLVGLGELYDPMRKLRGKLSSSIQDMNNMVVNESLAATQALSQTNKDLYNFMKTQNKLNDAKSTLADDLIWDTIKEENVFIATLMVAVIIIVFFMLIEKKCC